MCGYIAQVELTVTDFPCVILHLGKDVLEHILGCALSLSMKIEESTGRTRQVGHRSLPKSGTATVLLFNMVRSSYGFSKILFGIC